METCGGAARLGRSAFLSSYEAERKPIGLRNTGASRKYASRMHDAVVPDNIEAEGPAGDAARAEAAKMTYVRYNHFNRAEDVDAVGVRIGGRYDGLPSSLRTARPRRMFFRRPTTNMFRAGFPAGRPHLWLDDRRQYGQLTIRPIRPRFYAAAL